MKNNLLKYCLLLFFLLQNAVLFSQTDFELLNFSFQILPRDKANLYIPDHGDPLAFWEKSDFKFSIDSRVNNEANYYDSFSSNHRPIQIKLGYSFHPKFYAIASWFESSGDVFLSGNYNELLTMKDFGIGTYLMKMDEKDRYTPFLKYNSKWMMEKGVQANALLGYSRAKIQHKETYGSGNSEFNFNRFYGQGGVFFQRGIWGISAGSKIGLLNYSNTKIQGEAVYDLKLLTEVIMNQNNYFFFETATRVYLGTKFGQVYLNRVYTKTNTELSKYVFDKYTSVGIVLDIEGFIKSTKRKSKL